MAKYIERLEELRDAGKLSDEEFSELADLSAAKDAIKEFNSVRTERDELAAFKAHVETAPKRKEALQRVGIDYDALPKYGQKALDAIPTEDLDNLEKVAGFVSELGFEANLTTEQQAQVQTGAEQITQATVALGTGGSVATSKDAKQQAFLADLDSIPDGDKNAMAEVLAKHGMGPQSEG